MRATILPGFVMKLNVFAFTLGTQALPQWLNSLKSDSAYAPAAYSLEYGPQGGVGGYSYGGYGPQPTAVTTFSSTSISSETSGMCIHRQPMHTIANLLSLHRNHNCFF